MEVPFVHLESKGPSFPEIVRVHGILGQRAIAQRLMSEARLQSLLIDLCDSLGIQGAPSPATTRRWAAEAPGYPDYAVGTGIVPVIRLAPWASAQMAPDVGTSSLHQADHTTGVAPARREGSIIDDVAQVLGWAAIVYIGVELLRSLSQPQRVNPAPHVMRPLMRPQREEPPSLMDSLRGLYG